jgi:hypothetical protein
MAAGSFAGIIFILVILVSVAAAAGMTVVFVKSLQVSDGWKFVIAPVASLLALAGLAGLGYFGCIMLM